ncbi:hypothetical protein BDR26DRAFT_863506 [Obelidium mucronatum]|nr:hypothetical protein BDR26DRAFT_863506 [Obelidium mucronatum]
MNKLQVQVAAASTTVEQKVAVGPMVSDTTARNACDEQQQQQQQTVQKHGTIGEATQDNNTTETCTETTTMTHHHEAKDAKKEEHIDDTLVFLDSIEAQELFELPKKADVQPLDIQPMHIIQPPREMKKSSFLKKEDEVLPLSDPVTVLPVLSAEVGGTIKQIHLLEPVAIVPSPAPHETQQQSSVDQPIGQPNTDSDAPLKKARRSSTTLASTTGSSITLTPTPPPPPPSHANEKSQTCTQSSPRQVKKSKSIELSAQATKPRPTSAKKSTPVSSSSRLTSATARKPKLRQQQPQHQQQQQKAEDSKQQLIKPQESIIKSKESLKESNMIGGFNDGANATPIIPISLAAAGASIMTKKSLLPPIGGNISAGSQHEEEDVVPGVLAGQISLAADGRVESTVSIKKGLVEQVDSAFCLDSAM